jgi:hypothetical protein
MKSAKKKRLAARGWAVGGAREFLGLAGTSPFIEEARARIICGSRAERA